MSKTKSASGGSVSGRKAGSGAPLIIVESPSKARTLERYLQEAPASHSKRQAAEEKRKELGK